MNNKTRITYLIVDDEDNYPAKKSHLVGSRSPTLMTGMTLSLTIPPVEQLIDLEQPKGE